MASRFWVGGSGTWDGSDTTHWAATSGGAGGQSVPGSSDTVTFDANSGSATITLGTSPTVTSITSSSALNTFTMGSNTLTVNGTGTPWNWTAGTLNAGTSQINFTGSSGTYAMNGLTYYNVTWNGQTGNITVNGNNTFNNFTWTPGSPSPQSILTIGGNWTINGTLTLTAFSSGTVTSLINVASALPSFPSGGRTITAAAVALSGVNFFDITAAGAAIPFTGTRLGNGGGNSNITFSTPTTVYWVGNGGNWNLLAHWSASSGGATGATMPLAHDAIVFDANSFSSGSQTVSVTNGTSNSVVVGGSVNFTGATNTPAFSSGSGNMIINGNATFISAMTTGGNNIHFTGRGSQTLTNGGVTFSLPVNINAPGGTYTQADAHICTGTFQVNMGTFVSNGFGVQCSTLNFSGDGNNRVRACDMTNSLFKITGTTGTVLNINSATNLTLTVTGSTVEFSAGGAGTRTYAVNGAVTLGNVKVSAGSDNWASSGLGIKCANLDFTGFTGSWNADGSTVNGALTLNPGMTLNQSNTVTVVGALNCTGTAGNVITIKSNSAGTRRTLSKASGTVVGDYLNITDSGASGGAGFYAGLNSTNTSNNTGWIFGLPPTSGMLAFF